MYPTIPVGPLALPTGPVLAMLAAVFGLEMMGRYGRRHQLSADELWNVGLVTLLVGLAGARIWNVFQFWDIYREEPWLVVSMRPSGFVLMPGIIIGLMAGFLFISYKALEPGPVVASAFIGIVAGSILIDVSRFLTGEVAGVINQTGWSLNPLDPAIHPAALYRAGGMLILLTLLWIWSSPSQPAQTIGKALLGIGVVRLIADGFISDAPTVGGFRVSQLLALALAVGACLLLARSDLPKSDGNE